MSVQRLQSERSRGGNRGKVVLDRELIKKTSDDDRRIFDPREVTLSRKSKEREARRLRP
jgi:hypothetical protein